MSQDQGSSAASSSSGSSSVDLGAMGRSTVFQYWNDLAANLMATGQETGQGWLAVWQDLLMGRATPERYVDMWRHWMTGWMGLALWPQQWWYQRVQSLPSLVFIFDQHTQASPHDQAAPVPIDLGSGQLESTDLQGVGGRAAGDVLPRSAVRAKATDDNRRISVGLVGLGGPPEAPVPPKQGIYAGVVYLREQSVRRPVALVYLFVEPAGH